MKFFTVAALLVASVASQNLDLLKLNKEKSMLKFNRPLYDEVMLKKLGYPVEKTMMYGDNVEVPTLFQEELMDKKVLQLEELIMTPLFREYMTLPLFRQFWSYPMFQKYVASIYFQKFWEIPSFQQYFVTPALFYKNIYPLVTIFKYETNTMTTTTYGDDLIKGDYIYRNKNVFPFVYGQRDLVNNKFFVPTLFNQEKTFNNVFYKNLLEKLSTDLYTVNKPVDTIFDFTKKVTPVVEKMIDPITGEIKYITINKEDKLINELKTIYGDKIVKDDLFKTIYGDKIVKDDLLKTIFGDKIVKDDLFKTIYGDKIVKDNLFQTVYGDKIVKDDLLKTIFGDKIVKDDLFRTVYGNKIVKDDLLKTIYGDKIVKDDLLKTIFGDKIVKDDLFRTVYGDKIVKDDLFQTIYGDKIVKDDLLKTIFGDKLIKDEIRNTRFNTLFGDKLVKDALLKKMLLKKMMMTPEVFGEETFKTVLPEEMLFNEKYNTMYKYNPLVARMMNGYTKKFNPLMLNDFETEKMMLNKKELEQEILPMYLKKDLLTKMQYNKLFDNEMNTFDVTPKMVDVNRFEHIPLTQGKPIMGVRSFDKIEKVIPEMIQA